MKEYPECIEALELFGQLIPLLKYLENPKKYIDEMEANESPKMGKDQYDDWARSRAKYLKAEVVVLVRKMIMEKPPEPQYGVMDPDYARFVSKARCIAKAEGYAIAVHGSFSRDLDVIAIPWVETPNSTPSQLAHQLAGRTRLTLHPEMQLREHGRMTWTMHFPEFGDPRYVDFSVMPPIPPQNNPRSGT